MGDGVIICLIICITIIVITWITAEKEDEDKK
jgi:hypothetical protein